MACLCLAFLAQAGHTQRYYVREEPPYLPVDSLQHILQAQDSIVRIFYQQDDSPRGVTLEKNGALFFMLSGFSYVWEWQDDRFVNRYVNQFHGYNFGAYKFVYKNRIYSYGGTGFWQYHPFLIYFDETKREWEIMPYANTSPDVEGNNFSFVFSTPEALFVYFRDERPFRPTRTITPLKTDNFYRLDLQTYTWESLGAFRIDYSSLDNFYYVETENYLCLFTNIGYGTLLHKPSLRLKKQVPLDFSPLTRGSKQQQKLRSFHVQGDTVTVLNRQFKPIGQINLQAIYEQAEVGSQLAYQPSTFWRRELRWLLVIPLLLGLAAFAWWRYRMRPLTDVGDEFPYPALLNHKGEIISVQRLDQCLDIPRDVSNSARRNRRSQAIKRINAQYPEIIHVNRERSEEDARTFVYRIT